MNKPSNPRRIRDILLYPRSFFTETAREKPQPKTFFLSYGLPLMVLAAAGRMARVLQQQSWDEQVMSAEQLSGVFLISLAAYLLSAYLGAVIMARMGKPFLSSSSVDDALLLIMISYTPFLLAQPLTPFSPSAIYLSYIGLAYTLILLYRGSGVLMGTPAHKRIGYTFVAFFVIFGIAFLTTHILSGFFIHP